VKKVLKLEHAPSAIPDGSDRTMYLVIDASRCNGHVFREVPIHSTNLEQVLADLVEGQYVKPVRVVGFNVGAGWSRDMSAEVARIIKFRNISDRRNLPKAFANSSRNKPIPSKHGRRFECPLSRAAPPKHVAA
jgi:hypothetical protein